MARLKSSTKFSVITISEFKQLNNRGFLYISPERSFAKRKNSDVDVSNINKLLFRTPDMGNHSDYYILVFYREPVYYCSHIFKQLEISRSKNEVIDIRSLEGAYALTNYAHDILDLPLYTRAEKIWPFFEIQKTSMESLYKGYFFLNLFFKEIKNIKIYEKYDITTNIGSDIIGLDANEQKKCNIYSETYAFGWRASIAILERILRNSLNESYEYEKIKYWPLKNLKEKIQITQKRKFSGCVFEDNACDIYETMKQLNVYMSSFIDGYSINVEYLGIRSRGG